MPYLALADTVLALHVGLVGFVVGGLVATVIGGLRGWAWVGSLWFRAVHLAVIAVVVAEAVMGWTCPLTTLERWLRRRGQGAGESGAYAGGFVAHWLQALLFWDWPACVFTAIYTAFGLAVAAAWWCFPPRAWRRPG